MRKITLLLMMTIFISTASFGAIKIRDLASVQGMRTNDLIGYGLVVGLAGTGDGNGSAFMVKSLAAALTEMGVAVSPEELSVSNVAAVMVVAKYPSFARAGTVIDVQISSTGDAGSLAGGTLLLTPLKAPNGQVFAVAQGQVVVGSRGNPTSGVVPSGAYIEREVPLTIDKSQIELVFHHSEVEDLVRSKSAINAFVGMPIATIDSPTTLKVNVPDRFRDSYFDFLNGVLNVEITPADKAKVTIDRHTGTVVMGADVKISTVAVAHGDISIVVGGDNSNPDNGSVVNGPDDLQNSVDNTMPADVYTLPQGVSISEMVKALNAIGATPQEVIDILQTIKSSGALHAQLEII